MVVVGVDACKGGWIVIALRAQRSPEAHFINSVHELRDRVPDTELVAIDIPIGLKHEGRRRADVEARKVLGPRRHTVFVTPVRQALEAPSHAEATKISAGLTGTGISQQAYALREKIFEVERWLPIAPCPVREVHPELCFRALLGAPAVASKKTWAGMDERRQALARAGIVLDDLDTEATRRAGVDDVLDATVAAWSARRILNGEATSLPAPPEVGPNAESIAMWA